MIPKQIFQTWKVKQIDDMDMIRKKYVKNVKFYNRHMEHFLYDDDDCKKFVKDKFPEYYNDYKKLELPVQKADLWRYLVIYHYGGYYLDIDCICVKRLDGLKSKKNLLVVEIENPAPFKFADKFPCNPQYAQYWFGATPHHPTILRAIKNVIKNIRKKKFENKRNTNDYTLYLTGPVPWTKAIYKCNKNIIKLETNYTDSLSKFFDTDLFSQYTGSPVIHCLQGSWKQ